MSKMWTMALALIVGAGLLAAPAMAQDSDADSVGSITRGGGEGVSTALGKKGLVIETDGFKLAITTRVQFRLTYQNEVAHGNDGQNGRDFINFRVRRAKTTLSGYIFEKEFQYKATLSWASGANIIEEAFFRWAILQYINVTAGQAKLPWNWEEITSSGSQQFVERGYVNEVFNQDFAKGITIDGKVDEDISWLKYWVGVYNGVTKGEADFRNADQALPSEAFTNRIVDGDMMVNLRLETHPLGDVAYGMNDQRGEDEHGKPIFAVGLGVNWLLGNFNNTNIRPDDSGAGATGSGRSRTSHDTLAVTLDGHFRMFGISVDVAVFMRHTEFHNHGRNKYNPTNPTRNGTGNFDDLGFTFEVAYFILPKQLNVGIRWNWLNSDEVWQAGSTSRRFGVRPDANEIGLSVNYYVHGENLKLTFDLLYVSKQLPLAMNADGAGGSQSIQGIYTSPPARSAGSLSASSGAGVSDYADTWIIRLQLQWIF